MTLPGEDRRLIEDYLPLEALSEIASREKLHPGGTWRWCITGLDGSRLRRCAQRFRRSELRETGAGASAEQRACARLNANWRSVIEHASLADATDRLAGQQKLALESLE